MFRSLLLVLPFVALISAANTCSFRIELPIVKAANRSPKPISEEALSRVRKVLIEKAKHSWELGTETQAFIEYSWPEISVFDKKAFPPIRASEKYPVSDVIAIADRIVATKPPNLPILIDGDGAAGDPPSLGIAVLYANYSKPSQAASDALIAQLDHLLYNVPRHPNGAISHRESEAQLWNDFVAMVPPFIAYYGALHKNRTLLEIGYEQCKFYREVLLDHETGLWRHIMGGSWQDPSLWGTGIAWAAWGMLRVHQTLAHSDFAREFARERHELLDWVTDLVLSSWEYRTDEGLIWNHLGCDVPETNFGDTASTALIASVTYRLADIYSNGPHISPIRKSRLNCAVEAANEAYTTIAKKYISDEGVLNGAVDPLSWSKQLVEGQVSPEGQAFVLIMEAGRRAWKNRYSKRDI